jgi:hypothetical protein
MCQRVGTVLSVGRSRTALVGRFVRVERLAVLAYVNHRRLISNSMI